MITNKAGKEHPVGKKRHENAAFFFWLNIRGRPFSCFNHRVPFMTYLVNGNLLKIKSVSKLADAFWLPV
ncbi:MAG: hypothetical protein CVU70_01390 [Deltaproteobacteria bacterium HGW-Deltaproteobacteria-5]|jgi:hypothetical protein|nr:MAG: hypothetical protein CVU70_01390 [Deltaproteobacteria bacterium HGW-Deltaproteobacteria-5]